MDNDDDIKIAIAMSLEEAQKPPPCRQDTPASDDDDEEAQFQRDLQNALEASKAESSRSCASSSNSKRDDPPSIPPSTQELPTPLHQTVKMSAFINERAEMEKERLERQKRMRNEEPEKNGAPTAKKQRTLQPTNGQGVQTLDTLQKAQASAAELAERFGVASSSSSASNALYWDGELRQTANRLVEKDINSTFRISEIIGSKTDISFAILSSYANMVPWIHGFFDPHTPVILVNQPGPDGNSGTMELMPNWIMTKPFLRGGRGCMHIKLMLIFYKDNRLRVVVPTANFVDYDWRDIENTVWLQDIPMRQTPIRHDAKTTDFAGTLQRVLHTLNVPAALKLLAEGDHPNLPIEALTELRMRWDWSKVKVKLVTSLAGKHEGWDQVVRTGHPALMKAIQDIGARSGKSKELVLECQGSSIGNYSTQWMNEFYCSAKGESAKTWLDKPKSQRSKLPWPSVKIVFPSLQTVKDSVLGLPGGGTMFCRKSQWEAKNFPREMFHDSNSKRGGVLMHSKMIVGTLTNKASAASSSKGKERFTDSEDEDTVDELEITNDTLVGWAYIGSHNFTPSAWGTLSGSSSNPSLNIVNFEMGVVVPLRSQKDVNDVACWKRPARKYILGKDKAWMQDEMREAMSETRI